MEKEKLDREVEQTFPASDAQTISQPHEEEPETGPTLTAKHRRPHSPDWMYEKKAS